MSIELLIRLQEAHAFDHAPLRRDLGVYHVPFSELIPGKNPEVILAGVARRGERAAVVGQAGSGKSSLIEHVLGPSTPGIAPIAVPVFAEPYEIVTKVQAVAGLIIQTLADHADLGDEERATALAAASEKRTVPRRRRVTGFSLGGSWMGASLQVEVKRQVPSSAELPRTAQATLEVLEQLLAAIQKDGYTPVLVFDDTDRWFRTVGGAISHHDLALAFFGTVLPELRQLSAGMVVAAHNTYMENPAVADQLRSTVEIPINIPTLSSARALGQVIRSRVVAHTCPDDPASAPPLTTVIQDSAVHRLQELYSTEFHFSLRDVIRTMHVAVTEACNGGYDTLTPELVSRAAAW